MVAPELPGRYCSFFRFKYNSSKFGQKVWADIHVVANNAPAKDLNAEGEHLLLQSVGNLSDSWNNAIVQAQQDLSKAKNGVVRKNMMDPDHNLKFFDINEGDELNKSELIDMGGNEHEELRLALELSKKAFLEA